MIIRHLILPGQVENSLKVLDWIGENFAPGQVLVSLMRQYTPMPGMSAPFDRKIIDEEYEAVLSWMYLNGLQGFTQEASSGDTAFIPQWERLLLEEKLSAKQTDEVETALHLIRQKSKIFATFPSRGRLRRIHYI